MRSPLPLRPVATLALAAALLAACVPAGSNALDAGTPVPDAAAACEPCAGATPLCDPAAHRCVACLGDGDCPPATVCHAGRCQPGCSAAHTDCGDAGACDVQAGRCTSCASDRDCADPARPACDRASGRCQPCLPTDDRCPDGTYCALVAGDYACQPGCKVDADCSGDGGITMACCDHACVDTSTSSDNCGTCGMSCGMEPDARCCAGQCFHTRSDVAACGACGHACVIPNATAVCHTGNCAVMACNPGFTDCNFDPSDGCEIATGSDKNNCGGCGLKCAPLNATPVCVDGACAIASCNAGFADCDADAKDGCEVDILIDPVNCGVCGQNCGKLPNAMATCAMGQCTIGGCTPGHANCDKLDVNGCEVDTTSDTGNCGACGRACPNPGNMQTLCMQGQCGLGACLAGFTDCDNNLANGCEVHTDADPKNCGACGNVCMGNGANATAGCAGGKCALACNAGFGNCDMSDANGCEVNLNTDNANCGACGSACPMGQTCQAGACKVAGSPYVHLVGMPNPATVFSTIERTFYYPNNLVNGIWHGPSNLIIAGDSYGTGYWSHSANAGNYPGTPNNPNPAAFHRCVFVPAANMVVYSEQQFYAASASRVNVAHIDPKTGALSSFQRATWSDNFAGTCNLFSASGTEFMCFDGGNVRRYTMTEYSPLLTFVSSLPLNNFQSDRCANDCYSGTFAWDGAYYYFAAGGNQNNNPNYQAYDSKGNYAGSWSVGSGSFSGAYFDWSVGRYVVHSGWGDHGGGMQFTWSGGAFTDDSQAYGPVSGYHSF